MATCPLFGMPMVAGIVRVSCPKGSGFVVYYVFLALIVCWTCYSGVLSCLLYSLITAPWHPKSSEVPTGILQRVQ